MGGPLARRPTGWGSMGQQPERSHRTAIRSLGGEQRQRHTRKLELAWEHMWDIP